MLKLGDLRLSWGSGGRARPLFFFSLIFALIVFLASWFKEEGIKSVVDHDRKLAAQKEDLKRIEAENEQLRQQIRSVREGNYLMEKYAREKLLMARKNEVVFRFYDDTPHNNTQHEDAQQ